MRSTTPHFVVLAAPLLAVAWGAPTLEAQTSATTELQAARQITGPDVGPDLRRRLVSRDEQALVELIEVANPWLLGVTQGMLSDPDEASEVVLEVFAAAWDRVDSLGDEHDALMPWLLRIARNRAIDRLRRRRRFKLKLARAEAFGELPPDRVHAVEVDEAAQPGWHVHRSVHAALDGLPAEQREVVRLAYFQGFTHSEIASQLAIPMGTVKTRLRLAFDKLRASLAPIKDWIA